MVDAIKTPLNTDEFLTSIEQFYFAYRAFTAHPDKLLAQRGLGRVHHRILYFVGRKPAMPVSALQETLQVSKQALNAPLRQLMAMKLVAAVAAPRDRRVKELSLTEKGKQLEQQLTATQIHHLDKVFKASGRKAAMNWQQVMQKMSDTT
jgi:DNA-binding MarR family transcriptional regulator